MASPPISIDSDEESEVLPTGQYPLPSDSNTDITQWSKHEVADGNPASLEQQAVSSYLKSRHLKQKYSSYSSTPNVTQSSSSLLSPMTPRQYRSIRKLSGSCTDRGRRQKNKDCGGPSEKEEEDSVPELRRRNDSTKDSDRVDAVNQFTHDDSHQYLNTLPSRKPGQSHATSKELDDRDSSTTPASDSSSSTTETYIDNRKRQIIDRIVFTVMQWLNSKLDIGRKNAGGNSNSASGISEAPLGSHLRTGLSNSDNHGNKKRKAAERDDHDTDNEDECGKREDPRGSGVSIQWHEDPKYACPYFKYNPGKYKDWRTCPGPGWSDVHRVKEHLYRRHRQPQHRCARCWQPFADEQGVMDHQRTDIPCLLREMEYIEGFDAVQERSLRSRKRANQKLTEVEKWRRVFNILFPHILEDDIPSPFYDYNQVSQKDDDSHIESGYLEQCEQYMLREVPQRLRQALGRELDRDLSIVEENLRQRVGDWVKTLLEEAFQELRQIRRLDSPAQQPDPSNDIPAPAEGTQLPISELFSAEGANLHFEGEGESWLDSFDFDSFDPSSVLGDLQSSLDNGRLIEDLLRPGEDVADGAAKQSDSGYVSNSPG